MGAALFNVEPVQSIIVVGKILLQCLNLQMKNVYDFFPKPPFRNAQGSLHLLVKWGFQDSYCQGQWRAVSSVKKIMTKLKTWLILSEWKSEIDLVHPLVDSARRGDIQFMKIFIDLCSTCIYLFMTAVWTCIQVGTGCCQKMILSEMPISLSCSWSTWLNQIL